MISIINLIYIISVIFAVAFVLTYLRILTKTSAVGPEPSNLIILAVGFALIGSYIIIEFANKFQKIPLLIHIEKFYFFLGNFIVFYVLYRLSKELGD